jgi:hypothetical protein
VIPLIRSMILEQLKCSKEKCSSLTNNNYINDMALATSISVT